MPDQVCPNCGSRLQEPGAFCANCGAATPTTPLAHAVGAGRTTQESQELEAALSQALRPTYLLVRRLSAGGMGTVFLAREPALKRLVAVKVLAAELAADPGARNRFEREAQAVARLSHPNVVAIHSLGALPDGRPYFVMQYVDGPSMAGRVAAEGALDVDEGRRVIGHVDSALAAAHKVGIIHRDIKPANVLYETESGHVLVSDFGIAAVRPSGEEPTRTKLTGTGLAIGTPQYVSPEQLLAEEVTDRTDIYGLGLLAYELLTGHAPFQATTPQELIAAHLRDVPKRLAEIRPDVDPELDSLIARCLAKPPEDRPAAREIAARLTPGADTPLEWPPQQPYPS